MRMPMLEFTVNAAQCVVQGVVADPSPNFVQGTVLQQEEWERQCAMCKVVVSLASDSLILHPEDISDWCGHHPAGHCQACSNMSDTAFKSAVKKAQKARAKALGARRNRARNMDWSILEARILELHPGANKADARRLVFARINLFLASWAAAISKEDTELKEVRTKI